MAEPWLREVKLEVDAVIAPILFALQQVREDLRTIHCDDFWEPITGIPTLGFQFAHIAGSLDRLTTYLEGRQLSEAQLEFLASERTLAASGQELMELVEMALRRTEEKLRQIDPATYAQPRYVGRRRIETTVIGLAIHLAEHTQRHCGQAITTAKVLSAKRA